MGCKRQGFTLTELAVTLVLAGLFAGVALKFNIQNSRPDCVAATEQQMKVIRDSVNTFVVRNDRFPRPALRQVGIENKGFGREIDISELTKIDEKDGILFGALPFQALGLSPAYASDCWGNKFSYAVTKDLTDSAKFNSTSPLYVGAIKVSRDSSDAKIVNDKIAYSVISHGENAIGAVNANYGGSAGAADKKWCSLGTSVETENCEIGNARIVAASFNDGKNAGSAKFDDIVIYGGKNPRAIDGVCAMAKDTCVAGKPGNFVPGACGTNDTWQCLGIDGGATASCTIASTPCPIGGVCGASSGGTFAVAPTTDLCTTGTASAITSTPTKFSWTCSGQFGGAAGNCEATRNAACSGWKSTCEPYYSSTLEPACAAGGGYAEFKPIAIDNMVCGGEFRGDWRCCGAAATSKDCTAPWGATIPDGTSVNAYSASMHADCSSIRESRKCTNGTLSGSYTHETCVAPSNCTTPWGATVASGSSVTAYSTDTHGNCDSVKETRSCNNGTLSGSYTYEACAKPNDCVTPWGSTVANGSSTTAYSTNTAPNCNTVKETRTCSKGTLSGSFEHESCTSGAPPSGCGDSFFGVLAPCQIPSDFDACPADKRLSCTLKTGSCHGKPWDYYDCKCVDDAACAAVNNCTFNGTLTWGTGCSANYSGTQTDGATFNLANTAAGYTGASNFTCNKGTLKASGSTCDPAPKSCTTAWGATVPHGGTVVGYSASSGFDCNDVKSTMTCVNGYLAGSDVYTHASCTSIACSTIGKYSYDAGGQCWLFVNDPKGQFCKGDKTPDCADSCNLPWGGPKIPHGTSVTAYQTNSHANCASVSQTRTCNSGVLSGSYTFQSCSAPTFCNLPWGGTIASGSSVTAYQTSSHANCASVSQTRTCNSGVLSGSYTFQSCTTSISGVCGSDNGKTNLASPPTNKCSAGTAVGGGVGSCIEWAGPFGDCSKVKYSWTCTGSGGGSDASCSASGPVAYSSCSLPWGGSIAHGASVTAYQTNSHANCASVSQTRTCNNGVLSGSYTYQSCTAPAACTLPWGGSIASGSSVTAYQTNLSSNCASVSQTRTCNSGVLSGSYTYQSCSAPAACTLPWGGSIASGSSVTAYQTNLSSNCASVSQTRTCNNGVLSGSYTYQSCSAPAACSLPWGGSIASGSSVTAYQTNSHANCASVSQTRTCNNGVLSGSYTYQSCSAPVPTCTAWAQVCEPVFSATLEPNCVAGGGVATFQPIKIDNPKCGGEWLGNWRCCK